MNSERRAYITSGIAIVAVNLAHIFGLLTLTQAILCIFGMAGLGVLQVVAARLQRIERRMMHAKTEADEREVT